MTSPALSARAVARPVAPLALGALAGTAMALNVCSPLSWALPGRGAARAPQLAQVEIGADGGAQLRGSPAAEHQSKASAHVVPLLVGLSGLGAVATKATQRRSRAQCRASRDAAVVAPERAGDDAEEEEEAVETCEHGVVLSRTQLVRGAASAAGAASCVAPAEAEETPDKEWVQYDLNTGETLYDIDFDPLDPSHGFVVGARGLFYETKDYGKRWVSRSFKNLGKGGDQDISYRFQAVSINGDDVWIVGKPALLLHSKDSGKSWKKVPVSRKLPGEPKLLLALGPGKGELATSSGAVYITDNDGKNWRSVVKETVDATLNRVSGSGVQGASYYTGSVKSIKRRENGSYLAVAQRGNFYLTYTPGEPRWIPHNRIAARRIQAMGFRETGNGAPWEGVWMSLNGGYLTSTEDPKFAEFESDTKELFKPSSIRTGGIGIIDAGWRTASEGWAVGGSGVIYTTNDGGKTWQFDPSGKELPCNLYNVKFFNKGKVGYMIGSAGILLRRVFEA